MSNLTQKDKDRVMSADYQREMGQLMSEVLTTPGGLQALAAAVAGPIEQTIKHKEITSLLLTEVLLPPGEAAKFQKRPEVKAYFIGVGGSVMESELGTDEVEFAQRRVAANPMVDISVLKHGNIGALNDVEVAAGNEIRKLVDAKTLTLLAAATPVGNTVTCAGGVLTKTALIEAMGKVEDLEARVAYIVARGARIAEMKEFDMDPVTERELQQKGVVGFFSGAAVINSASMPLDTVQLVPDVEVGKAAYRTRLQAEPNNEPKRFKTGWVCWTELAQGVTFASPLAKITITA